MSFRVSPRWAASLLLGVGCSDLVALGHGEGASGGAAGQAGTPASGVAGTSAGSAVASAGFPASGGNTGGAGDDTGDAGAAGGFILPPGEYRLDVVDFKVSDDEELLPNEMSPNELPQPSAGEELLRDVTLHVNENGSLAFGTAVYRLLASEPKAKVLNFLWTPQTGLQRFDNPDGAIECMAADGSTAFGRRSGPPAYFRWTLAGGAEPLSYESSIFPYLGTCSPDGKTAVGAVALPWEAAIWQAGQNDDAVVRFASLPDGSEVGGASGATLSTDGTAAIIGTADSAIGSPPGTFFRWTAASGITPLGNPTASPCFLAQSAWHGALMNGDASVIAVDCFADGNDMGRFRWTLSSGTWQPLAPEIPQGNHISWMSEDGLSLIGTDGYETPRFFSWIQGQPVEYPAFPLPGFTPDQRPFVSNDGNTAYLSFWDADRTVGARWRRGQGFTTLPDLPGHDWAGVRGCSADGSVAIGSSFLYSDYQAGDDRVVRGVIWDAHGARDLETELVAAGVDLQGLTGFNPVRIWSGSKLVIQGTAVLTNSQYSGVPWFAEIPVRD